LKLTIEWKTCLRIGLSIFALYLCIHFWPLVSNAVFAVLDAAMPFFIGGAIAYAVNIPMTLFERFYFPRSKKKIVAITRRPVCMAASVIILLALITLIIALVIPQLAQCIQIIIAKLPGFIRIAITKLDELNLLPDSIADTLAAVDWKSRIGQIIDLVKNGVSGVVDMLISTVSTVFTAVLTALLSVIFAIYILLSKDTLTRQYRRICRRYLSEKFCSKLFYVTRTLGGCFKKYIVGQCTEALILGVLCTLGMLILRLPYATMIGALIAFTALIPIAGAYIGAAVGAFMILTVSPVQALVFLIFLVILQQVEGNVIYPKVVGSSIGLPGLWVLLAVTIGGGIFGILGMIIGVPLAAAAYRILRDDVYRISPLRNTKETVSVPDTAEEQSE